MRSLQSVVLDTAVPGEVRLSIAAVERDTGLSKDTLRVWERRYGFPHPGRDPFGERAYPLDQVEKLRVIKRLMDAGHRPGRIVALPIEELRRIGDESRAAALRSGPDEAAPQLRFFANLVRQHDVDGLRRALRRTSMRLGLARFVVDVVAPLNALIGDQWMRGHLEVFEEHLYTESMQVVLRQAIAGLPSDESARPRVLLTTFPNEPHGLGLLMAETCFAIEGAVCIGLGTQTPIWDIVLAASAQRADIVALSFSPVLSPASVAEGLRELREKLPRPVELWAGGTAPALRRRSSAGVELLASMEDIAPNLRRWRAARG